MKYLHKAPKVINIPYRLIVAILFIITLAMTSSKANEPSCEVFNHDTQACETYNEQDLGFDTNLTEFYGSPRVWTAEEVQAYIAKG